MKEILHLIENGNEASPISSTVICRELSISDSAVRRAVNKYRSIRIPIMANSCGYWIARTPTEVQEWLDRNHRRISKQLRAHNQVAKYAKGWFNKEQGRLV